MTSGLQPEPGPSGTSKQAPEAGEKIKEAVEEGGGWLKKVANVAVYFTGNSLLGDDPEGAGKLREAAQWGANEKKKNTAVVRAGVHPTTVKKNGNKVPDRDHITADIFNRPKDKAPFTMHVYVDDDRRPLVPTEEKPNPTAKRAAPGKTNYHIEKIKKNKYKQ